MLERPILIVLLGYLIGIIIGLYCKIGIAIFIFAIPSICLILSLLGRKTKQYIKIFNIKKATIIFLISAIISSIIVLILNHSYENKYKNIQEANFVATVISSPDVKEYYSQYKIKVEKVNNSKEYQNTQLYLNLKENRTLKYGDKISFTGEFIEPEVRRNYKGFSYKEYLKSIGIYGSVKASRVQVIGKSKVSFIKFVSNYVENFIKDIVNKNIESEDNRNLLLGILLGYDNKLDENIRQNFEDSSLSHILAVSGMHVSYVILGINILFTKIGTSKKITQLGTSMFLIFFIFLTGETPSVKRACIMAILSIRCKWAI